MKAEFKNGSLIIIPETNEETEEFNRLFPEQFMRNSRYLNIKQFVDMFGNPEPNRPYLLINGYDPSEVKTVRPRAKKDQEPQPQSAVSG